MESARAGGRARLKLSRGQREGARRSWPARRRLEIARRVTTRATTERDVTCRSVPPTRRAKAKREQIEFGPAQEAQIESGGARLLRFGLSADLRASLSLSLSAPLAKREAREVPPPLDRERLNVAYLARSQLYKCATAPYRRRAAYSFGSPEVQTRPPLAMLG